MELIFFTGGAVVGTIITTIFKRRSKTFGLIEVDHRNDLCNVRLTSSDLQNRKIKKAVFEINHNAILSREEHIL